MTDQPRVFVVQQPVKMNHDREWKPIFDIGPARDFGRLHFILLKPGNVYLDTLPTMFAHMRNTLKDFNDADFLLPTGEPAMIAAAAMIASAANGGRVKVLKWNRRTTSYSVIQLGLNGVVTWRE